jgi:hypothetical protein
VHEFIKHKPLLSTTKKHSFKNALAAGKRREILHLSPFSFASLRFRNFALMQFICLSINIIKKVSHNWKTSDKFLNGIFLLNYSK